MQFKNCHLRLRLVSADEVHNAKIPAHLNLTYLCNLSDVVSGKVLKKVDKASVFLAAHCMFTSFTMSDLHTTLVYR